MKKDFFVVSGFIFAIYFIFHITGIGCPIKYLTGVSCLGCGTTRAWLALLKGDVAAAFKFVAMYFIIKNTNAICESYNRMNGIA